MRYFDIPTIRQAIIGLQDIPANWLLPAFVFAANDVGTDGLVDLSKKLGTDQFLDRYFNGRRLHIPTYPTGNNLLRPRLKGIAWNRGPFAGDYLLRQDTKMWGNLFSSRGYREMRLQGLIEGEKAINSLTEAFQGRFEEEVPSSFRFEDFLVWLFAFEGFPDVITSWQALFDHLLSAELDLLTFKPPYQGRFHLSDPPLPWPNVLLERPTDDIFLEQLAPKLLAYLSDPEEMKALESPVDAGLDKLPGDDPVLSILNGAIQADESLAFLLAGPPGTGKTRYARQLANALTEDDAGRTLFLQFHPAIGYDDFIEGFRPELMSGGAGIKYDLADRLFLNFAKLAREMPERTFVVVIDELNRGDVARIFGEVLTYLEPDYREREFILPYSGKATVIPKNLIVIATANPFDRSVTELDDALLRRFWVIEMEPDGILLRSHLQNANLDDSLINRILQLFTILNRSFPHGFGHTNFLRVRSLEDLSAVWMGRVRLGLKRALMYDRSAFENAVTEIEALLQTQNQDGDFGGPDAV